MAKSQAKVEDFSRLRSKRRFVKLIITIITLVLVISVTLYIFLSDTFKIKTIKVIGTESISSKVIEEKAKSNLTGDYYYFFPKENILLYPSDEIKATVEGISQKISSVDVYRSGINKITVNVIERHPAYLWCQNEQDVAVADKCYFVDDQGIIYTDSPVFSDPVYIEFYGGLKNEKDVLGKTFAGADILPKLQNLIVLLDKEGILVKKVYLEEFGDIKIISNKNYELRFNLSIPVEDSVKNLRLSLASDNLKPEIIEQNGGIKYIDLRFDKKVYYKFNNE